jgi:phenylacetic acid degradation operon negative regulatory protein
MKLPLSDKFLWDLYNFLEKVGDIYDLLSPRPWREVWSPQLHKFRYEYEKKQTRKRFTYFVNYLKRKGYIKIKNLQQKEAVLLTKKGFQKVLKLKIKFKERKRRADKKWQMIIFDIPERKRKLRNLLREHLYLLGYKMLQQSVWICPFDVLKETEKIIREYSLDSYVKLFLIEEIEI